MNTMKYLTVGFLMMILAACSSRPVVPDTKDVEVSRKEAHKDCRELGKVTGQTMKIGEGSQAALDDLKRDAAAKGANYVRIDQYTESGTSVSGMGYVCP